MNSSATFAAATPAECAAWKLNAVRAALAHRLLVSGADATSGAGDDDDDDDAAERFVVLLYNLTALRAAVGALRSAFEAGRAPEQSPATQFVVGTRPKTTRAAAAAAVVPPLFLHTVAVKANPVRRLLTEFRDLDCGAECASYGELRQALAAGFDPQMIVFDSPAKTRREIAFALRQRVVLNVDNLQELQRVVDALAALGDDDAAERNVGLRINPQVGAGTIAEMSTATATSKFGIGLDDEREAIVRAYRDHRWLNGVMVHVGSQGCPLELISAGLRRVVALIDEIEASAGRPQIRYVDIGGGLPVNFDSDVATPTFADLVAVLRRDVPQLFSGRFVIITEYGRALNAKAGIIASRVEYTKVSGGRHIAATQFGGDLAVRTVFMPTKWPIRVSILAPDGRPKTNAPTVAQDIVGPLCFSGDVIAHQRPLPLAEVGDLVVAHDTGAYYYSAFSYYNSRVPPPIYGVEENSDGFVDPTIEPILLQRGKTVRETMEFFS